MRPQQKRSFQESTVDTTGQVTAAPALAHHSCLMPGSLPHSPYSGSSLLEEKAGVWPWHVAPHAVGHAEASSVCSLVKSPGSDCKGTGVQIPALLPASCGTVGQQWFLFIWLGGSLPRPNEAKQDISTWDLNHQMTSAEGPA